MKYKNNQNQYQIYFKEINGELYIDILLLGWLQNAKFKNLTEKQMKEFTIDFIKRSLKEKRKSKRNNTYNSFKRKIR